MTHRQTNTKKKETFKNNLHSQSSSMILPCSDNNTHCRLHKLQTNYRNVYSMNLLSFCLTNIVGWWPGRQAQL